MFVTSTDFEFPVPRALAQPGQRFWRSVGLSLNAPWFIVSVMCRDEDGDDAFCQDILMASDTDLAALLKNDEANALVGLQYVEPPAYNDAGTWRIRSVRKVWRPATDTAASASTLVFEDELGRFASPTSDIDPRRVGTLIRELQPRT